MFAIYGLLLFGFVGMLPGTALAHGIHPHLPHDIGYALWLAGVAFTAMVAPLIFRAGKRHRARRASAGKIQNGDSARSCAGHDRES